MDILLIAITIVIILGIAFILSRPFAHPKPVSTSTGENRYYHRQYEILLDEIKALQKASEIPEAEEETLVQIKEKKLMAANLLRLMDAPLEEAHPALPAQEGRDPEETQPEYLFTMDNTTICPQCGRRVASSDKFCTHCGNRLHP